MKNDANIRNFIEISGNLHGKSRKTRGKSGNFRGIHYTRQKKRWEFRWLFRSFFGRFRSFFRSFPVVFRLIPIDSAKSFRFIPNDSDSFRFLSFSFLFFPQYPDFILYNIFPAIPQIFKPKMLNFTRYNKIVIFLFGSI